MELPEKLPPARARAVKTRGAPAVEATLGDFGMEVYSEVEGREPSPLSLVAAALASCEALLFDLVASKLGAGYESVEVEAMVDFELGAGAREARVAFKVKGMDPETARRVVELVKRFCPIYKTLERAGARIEESVEA